MKPEKAFIFLLITALQFHMADMSAQNYSGSSVLGNGKWCRIAVTAPGIYRLDYSQIVSMGLGDPASVAVYGNNVGQLSFYNDGSAPDDLRKIGILMEKGSDNIFNEGDYILFYGEGTSRWRYNRENDEYSFSRHYYSDTAYYFITSKAGGALLLTQEAPPARSATKTSSSTDVLYRHEIEKNNLIKSGREWYQQVVTGYANTINPSFKNIITGEKVRFSIRVLARSDQASSFSFSQGTTVLKTIQVPPVNMTDINGVYANITTAEDSCLPSSSSPLFTLTYSSYGNIEATGYIDYVDLKARASLIYSDSQIFINDTRSVGSGAVTQYDIQSTSILKIWDVSDPFLPKIIESTYSGGHTTFRASSDSLRTFVAFSTATIMRPVITGVSVPNQDLHSMPPVNMVIVAHSLFKEYADKLSQFHLSDDGTSSVVVTPQQIYNEFSGGVPDASAIRNFVKMMYEKGKNSSVPLKYLMLFGDGSYENKTKPPLNTSYIPTWQSENSHIGVLSFTSDDFYGLLDDGEGEADGELDIGIGRLPVNDTVQAGVVTRKIVSYTKASTYGSWRNMLCMIADDEDANTHMTDAENLSETIAANAPPIAIDKIYLDAYRQVTSVSGNSYPDAVRAIDNRVEAGCLIFNYVGHGSETGLAHERVVRTDNINSWSNSGMLPLFITATCEFSRFDDVDINSATGVISSRTSAGEMVLLNPKGGGIGLMSTTRVVYSAPNFTLNNNIYQYAFSAAPDGRSMRFGDIIRLAKNNSGSGMNKRNFLLLGDPALRLAWPSSGKVVTDSINHVSVTLETDTLKALSVITISGHIEDNYGSLMSNFNGTVEPVVSDKETSLKTLANDGGSTMTFPVAGNTIFSGTTEAHNGRFSFSFIVPLDINYSFGKGRITYYAYNDTCDVNGNFTDLIAGGFSDIDIDDTEGPEIRLFMNDSLFVDGGTTDTSPTLLAIIKDDSGINATGAGIGHDIIAWIDGNQADAVTLNSLYRANINGHRSGSLRYPLTVSEKGEHTISLRAWDNVNNPSVATLNFIVETSGTFRLTDLLCYPNPTIADMWFTAGHNRPGSEINVTITIFSTSGKMVMVLKENMSTTGYQLPEIYWDGCDASGGRVARGIYFWRIDAVNEEGEKATASGKLIIL